MKPRTSRQETLPCGRPVPAPNRAAAPQNWEAKLQAYLGEQGLKQSSQRLRIVQLILSHPGHFHIQRIARHIHESDPGIGIATIYRNIKLLTEAGILKETLVDSEGQTIYELADDDHHDHIVCTDCGQIFEFHDEEIEELQSRACQKLKFKETRHRHIIYAQCQFKK